ncbi:hypothetical protein [Sphaerisporangium siamense]|uniref:Uncharacterized protein n=1 Tax=Sphaerisporangium siamense TaxID=795645 RepID=A0A7W7G9K2_9ACTN|nr:hypothetical protein [Sphaerisporangium siamense]MBB4702923.1 hypothetical protein [Sphaerisporangium siamense]
MDGFDCCDKRSCPGTCDYCGFSLCPEAMDVDRCDCPERKYEMSMSENEQGFDEHNFAAIDRGIQFRGLYTAEGHGDPDCQVTTATDLIADQLRSLPEDEWLRILKSALTHAHEEIHGWGTAEGLSLYVEGLVTADV